MKLKSNHLFTRKTLCLLAGLAANGQTQAQDALRTLDPMTVLGTRETVFTQTGSAAFVTEEAIRAANSSNVNIVLAKVPGVYVREEDGFGNFPNISLRGADGTRSEKVTVMEDDILTAPAPYAGPAAYYTPRIARMSGVEILKGSSQVRYGPQTTGGVINYLSTGIPEEQTFYAKMTYGSYNTLFGHAYYGDTVETEAGKFGYLLELHGNRSDGFRDIDGSSNSTGFSLFEPMLKLSFEPNTALKQRLEFKAGYTSFDADETYAGLTEADLDRDPDRRYAATRYDNIESEQYRTYLKWVAEPSDELRLESAVYYGRFTRNWYKLDKVTGAAGDKRSIHEILAPGSSFTDELSACCEARGRVSPTSRRTTAAIPPTAGRTRRTSASRPARSPTISPPACASTTTIRTATTGWTTYNADGAGNFNFAKSTRDGQDNRLEEIFATAIYLEDEIKTGKLTLRPGIRYEWLELDDRKTDNATDTSVTRKRQRKPLDGRDRRELSARRRPLGLRRRLSRRQLARRGRLS